MPDEQTTSSLTLEDLYRVRLLPDADGTNRAWLPPQGRPGAEIMLVLSSPTQTDARMRVLAGPEYLEEIHAACAAAGLRPEQLYITALVKHDIGGRVRPTVTDRAAGGAQLEQEIRLVQPRLIMTLGAEPYKWFMKRNAAVGADQGEFTDTPRGRILVNMSPGMVLYQDPKKRPLFQQPFLLAARFLAGTLVYDPFTWRVVTTVAEHLEIMTGYLNRGCRTIGYDAEWLPVRTGLHGEKLVSFQYSCVPGEAVILDLLPDPDGPENLELLDSVRVLLEMGRLRRVGWNIRADDKRLRFRGIHPPEETLAFDGMKAVGFIDSRFPRGLETGIRNFTGYEPYHQRLEAVRKRHKLDASQLARLRWLEPEEFFRYAAGDAVAHLEACRRMEEIMRTSPATARFRDYFFQTFMPLTSYFTDLELHGLPVDQAVLQDLTERYVSKHAEMLARLRGLVSPYLPEFNPASALQKRELLYKILGMDPPYWTKSGKSARPRAWYAKQKPETRALFQPSTNNRSLSTLVFEMQERQAAGVVTESLPREDGLPPVTDEFRLQVLECLRDLNRVGVFATKFLSRRGLPGEEPAEASARVLPDGTLPDEFPEEDALEDEDGEPLKQSYWAALAPDGRIHADFFECLANFRSSSKPNVQNPASKVLSAIPGIFVPGWAGLDEKERKARADLVPRNIRHLFWSGDPDLLWTEVDVAGADLAIAAFLSRDPDYIQDILLGNFHLKKAREYFRDERITKEDYSRYVSAKSITFRVAYTSELSAAALPIQAEIYAESGVRLPLQEIEYALSTWERYGRYMQYRKECKAQVEQGCIVNARGIPYYFDTTTKSAIMAGWQNESLAYPIASELALFMWDVAVSTRRELQRQKLWLRQVFPVNSVHDAGYWLVHRDLLKDRFFPEFIKHWFTDGCRIATGDQLGMEMVMADRWKGKHVEFAGETRWDFEARRWTWK